MKRGINVEATKIIMIVSEALRVSGFVCTLEGNELKGYSKSPAAALRLTEEHARQIAEIYNTNRKNTAIVVEADEMYRMLEPSI